MINQIIIKILVLKNLHITINHNNNLIIKANYKIKQKNNLDNHKVIKKVNSSTNFI
jgi:hypothetical protein